jgi:uncharacterized protein
MSYYKYSDYLKKKFGARVRKISVDAGFSCPNKDGRLSSKGCIYCDNKAFSYYARSGENLSVEDQIEKGIESAKRRFKAEKFIIYFQANTNTYASLACLKDVYDKVRKFGDIVSISIGTRPDCVDKDILELISTYAKDYEVWIEYGLQSMHDKTLSFINRGHSYNDFLNAILLTRNYPVKICAHVILGLPFETEEMMMATADEITRLRLDAVKIHPLHVIKGTALDDMYKKGLYKPLGLDEYRKYLKDFLLRMPSDTIIQRISAYCPKELLSAPGWVNNRAFSLY